MLFGACGNGKRSQGTDPAQTADPALGASVPANPTGPLQEDDLRGVCAGKGEARAKPYAKDGPAAHAITAFTRGNDKEGWMAWRSSLLGDFAAKAPQDYELVGCITRTSERKVETCTFDQEPPPHYLDLYEANYEITIREAATGKVVLTKTEMLPAEGCPSIKLFSAEREADYPVAEYAFVEMVKSLILPAGGVAAAALPGAAPPGQKVDGADLVKVCYGFAEPRAAVYAKVKGSVSPALMMTRSGEQSPFYNSLDPDFKPWGTEDASQYQLAICVAELMSVALTRAAEGRNLSATCAAPDG
jgi:hypothetical protein